MIAKLLKVVCVLAIGSYLSFNFFDFAMTKSAKEDYLHQVSAHLTCTSAGNLDCPRKPTLEEFGLVKSDFE